MPQPSQAHRRPSAVRSTSVPGVPVILLFPAIQALLSSERFELSPFLAEFHLG